MKKTAQSLLIASCLAFPTPAIPASGQGGFENGSRSQSYPNDVPREYDLNKICQNMNAKISIVIEGNTTNEAQKQKIIKTIQDAVDNFSREFNLNITIAKPGEKYTSQIIVTNKGGHGLRADSLGAVKKTFDDIYLVNPNGYKNGTFDNRLHTLSLVTQHELAHFGLGYTFHDERSIMAARYSAYRNFLPKHHTFAKKMTKRCKKSK